MPYVRGHCHLETHNCHLGNNGPNKVINDFNIFLGINTDVLPSTTVIKYPHLIGDAALDHQTYTNTTTWIQAWWGPFLSGSSPNKYAVVHSQFYLALSSTVLRCLIHFKHHVLLAAGVPFPVILPVLSILLCSKHNYILLRQKQFNTFWFHLKSDENCKQSRRPRTSFERHLIGQYFNFM